MNNPNNLCVFKGRLQTKPNFIKTKAGTEFAAEFFLEVQRNYRNNGIYLKDSIPLRMEGEQIMNFAHTLEEGDKIDVIAAFVTKVYNNAGENRQKSYFLITDIVKEAEKSTEIEEGDISVELPI